MEAVNEFVHSTEVYNTRSSDFIVPVLMDLFKPTSVLDVGCGIGTWLHSFSQKGISDFFGVDGDYVDKSLLAQFIPFEQYAPIDLNQPFSLNRKFDLVVCLEVAEHLLASAADNFISSLCQHAETIVFSAAIPAQGGQNHINEQWLDYWALKFDANGFKLYDVLRPIFWNRDEVDWWYKQNIVVFSKLNLQLEVPELPIKNVVHPQLFQQQIDYILYLEQYVKELESKIYKK